MSLHFSSERPEEQFYTDFGNLNKFGDEVRLSLLLSSEAFIAASNFFLKAFSQLGTAVITFLLDPQQVRPGICP